MGDKREGGGQKSQKIGDVIYGWSPGKKMFDFICEFILISRVFLNFSFERTINPSIGTTT